MVLSVSVSMVYGYNSPTIAYGTGAATVTITRRNGSTTITGLPVTTAVQGGNWNGGYATGVKVNSVSLVSFTLL